MKKLFIFIKCALICGVKNKTRFLLTILGLTISAVFLSYGIWLIDSYYNGQMQKLENIPQNAVMVVSYNSGIFDILYDVLKNKIPEVLSYQEEAETFKVSSYGDNTFIISTYIVGVGKSSDVSIVFGEDGTHLNKVNLLEGRLIDSDDVAKNNRVIVIDDVLQRMLFGEESALGKKISYTGLSNTYEIVGVVESDFYSKNNLRQLKNGTGVEDGIMNYKTMAYVPETVCATDFFNGYEDDEGTYGDGVALIWKELDKDEYDLVKQNITRIKNAYSLDFEIIDYDTEKETVINNIFNYRKIFVIIFIVLFIFSGMNCFNITLFSIKERIREIGIRKAYGANAADITLQFVSESVLISVIASLLGVLISFFLITNTVDIASDVFNVLLSVKIKKEVIVLPILLVILQTFIFSIIPSIYAAKIKVVDALHFE